MRWILSLLLVAGIARAAFHGPTLDGERFGIEPARGSHLYESQLTDADSDERVERRWELTCARSPESLLVHYQRKLPTAELTREDLDAYQLRFVPPGARAGEEVVITIDRSAGRRTAYTILERVDRRRAQLITAAR
jgi:hypothetical protein